MTAEALAIRPEWTDEEKDTIKATCAPGATDPELKMFLHVCKVAGLDPLQKQIWFMKRSQKMRDGEGEVLVDRDGRPRWEQKVCILAGADGLQARALRFPDCKGIRYAAVFEGDVFLVDRRNGEVKKHLSNPFKSGKCLGAWAVVDREGKEPFFVVVKFEEYFDKRSPVWGGKPVTMIEKVARATALRRAYPENFGGIYDPAEIAEDEPVDVTPIAATSNVTQLPPPRREPAPEPKPEPKPEPRVEIDPAETRARAAELAASAAKAQREQDAAEAEMADLIARAKKTGVPQAGMKSFIESCIGRKLSDAKRWELEVTAEERLTLGEDLVARELERPAASAPKPQPQKSKSKGIPVDTVTKTIPVTDRDGTTHTASTDVPV